MVAIALAGAGVLVHVRGVRVDTIVGRSAEQRQLDEAVSGRNAELVTVYGRRRVGKTHLVREFLGHRCHVVFSLLGEKDASRDVQLVHFHEELQRTFSRALPRPADWREALGQLSREIEALPKSKAVGVFLDEFPWLAGHRSGLVQALDYEWNARLSRIPNLCFVVCGSAASWMLNRLVHAKGGLYNRVTRRIQLLPFNLKETSEFLSSRRVRMTSHQVMELYMAVGGIPHYLMLVSRGQSAAQAIAEICFSTSGVLHDEYEHLFASLFNDSGFHRAIVEALGKTRSGLSRADILRATGQVSGGRVAMRLDELAAAGFIARVHYLNRVLRDPVYRLVDEYLLFYQSWIRQGGRGAPTGLASSRWLSRRQSARGRAWAGNAFEALCLKHARQIERALGIESIPSSVGCWRRSSPKGDALGRGAQIDLLFDREDGVVQLCELKYSAEPFTVTKAYARDLQHKQAVFEATTKTKKQVQWALISPHGLKRNIWSEDLVESVVTADDLFAEG